MDGAGPVQGAQAGAGDVSHADIGCARNVALRDAGYPDGARIRTREIAEGPLSDLARYERNGELAQYGVHFTPQDRAMVFALSLQSWESFRVLSTRRQKELSRPWRILVGAGWTALSRPGPRTCGRAALVLDRASLRIRPDVGLIGEPTHGVLATLHQRL